jgi:hypothetical protein
LPTETRYFRSDEWAVNGLTAEKLTTAQYTVSQYYDYSSSPQGLTVYWGIRVWKRASGGTETEITSGTPVAQVSRLADGEGLQSATWACPETSWSPTDAVVVRVYQKIGAAGAWNLCEDWITEQINASKLDSATWTVYYYTYHLDWNDGEEPPTTYTRGRFYWSTSTYNSRIANFTHSAGAILKTVTDILIITDSISDLAKVVLKTVTDTLGITDAVTEIQTYFLKIVSDFLKIYDRAFHAADPPSFGEYSLPHVTAMPSREESLFSEKLLPNETIAARETFGSQGATIEVTGWLDEDEKPSLEAMAHETRYMLDIWDKPTYCLMLKPKFTRTATRTRLGKEIYDYTVTFMALLPDFPLSGFGDPDSPVKFGVFGFPHVTVMNLGDTSISVDRAIPGAQVGDRTEIGATGRRVTLTGWMETDFRESMSNLADNVARTFTDGKDTFTAKMLKPQFTLNEATESIIEYTVELVEVSAP